MFRGWRPTDELSLTFYIQMPDSWTEKKKAEMDGQKHQQKPDMDNLIKSFKDALYREDCRVWRYGEMKKLWSRTNGLTVHLDF